MTAASKVDAIQAAVMKAAKAAMADYEKRNTRAKTPTAPEHVNAPPREFVEKVIRSRLSGTELIEAFVADVLAAAGHE